MSEEQEKQLPSATEPPQSLALPGSQQVIKASERVEMQRATAEVYASHQRAIQYPRDRQACLEEIMDLCDDVNFASEAIYSYSVGGETAEGINTKAAADIAQIWGNIESGIVIHGRYAEETQVRAFAIDLEKNFPRSSTITVPHERKVGDKVNKVTDPRQIKTLVAAEASKEERNGILRVLPNYLRAQIIKKCKQTMHQEVKDVKEAWFGWVKLYAALGVKEVSLLRYVNKKDMNKMTAADIVDLRVLYSTLRETPALLDQIFPERDKKNVATKDGEVKQASTEPPKTGRKETPASSAAGKANQAAGATTDEKKSEPAKSATQDQTTSVKSAEAVASTRPDGAGLEDGTTSDASADNAENPTSDSASTAKPQEEPEENTSTESAPEQEESAPANVATQPPKRIRLFN